MEKMFTFADNFWNSEIGEFGGWEIVVARLKEGKQATKCYLEVLKQRSQLEDAFGKNLQRLARSIPNHEELSSLSSVWSSLRNETDAAARSHMETAKMLMDEYSELNDALITLANKRRSLEEQVRQCQQKLKLDWRRVVEAKANYEKKCKEEIYCNQFYHQEISKFGKPSKEAERARQKLEKTQLCLKACDELYRTSVEEAEESRRQWAEVTRHSLHVFQQLEESRVESLLGAMWKCTNALSAHCVTEDNCQESIRQAMERCLENNCLETFVRAHATGSSAPPPITYEAKPTSSSMGLGHAASPVTTQQSPPKPPRLIHYTTGKNNTSFPIDSVDNIEYFNLEDPPFHSSSDYSANDESYSSSSSASEFRWTRDTESYMRSKKQHLFLPN